MYMRKNEKLKEEKPAIYARVGNPEEFEKKDLSVSAEDGYTKEYLYRKINEQMTMLSTLEKFANHKLIRPEKILKTQDIKAVIYIYGNDEENIINRKLDDLRKFCKRYKINIEKEVINDSIEKTYHNKEFENLIYDIYTNKINTIVLEDLYDIGDDRLINTYIINEIFSKRNIRLIAIKQKLDTNDFRTLVNYENPVLVQLLDFIDVEERKIRAEKIKRAREAKKFMKENK